MPISLLQFRPGSILPPRAYLDTNLLLHARDESSSKYHSAARCLRELIEQKIELNVSALVIDELWWGLFRTAYRLTRNRELTSREYKGDRSIWRDNWPRIRTITTEILEWDRIRMLHSASTIDLVNEATGLMTMNSLGPRDAFHLATTLHHGLPSFVTGDGDFDDVRLPDGRHLTIVKF